MNDPGQATARLIAERNFGICRLCDDQASGRDRLCRPCRGFLSAKKNFLRRQGSSYRWDSEKDLKLKRCYQCSDRRELSHSLSRLSNELGYPKSALRRRAEQLGITMWSHIRWTPDEISLLEEYAGVRTVSWIARTMRKRTGIGRSYNAVKCKAEELGRSLRLLEGYTLNDLIELFGTTHFTVSKWFKNSWLHTDRQGRVSEKQLLAFVRDHPCEWHFKRVDEAWMKGILFSSTSSSRLADRVAHSQAARSNSSLKSC